LIEPSRSRRTFPSRGIVTISTRSATWADADEDDLVRRLLHLDRCGRHPVRLHLQLFERIPGQPALLDFDDDVSRPQRISIAPSNVTSRRSGGRSR
jgi:hypothetical protein